MTLSIVECKRPDGSVAYPHIAPGAFIGPNCTIIGSAWIDNAIIRHSVSIRAEILEGFHNFFSKNPHFKPGHYPFSVIIGNGTAIDDNCTLHNTSDLNIPLVIEDEILIGHNGTIHGKKIGSRSVVFIGATLSENTILEAESYVGTGALVPANKHLHEGEVLMGVGAQRVMSAREDQKNRSVSSHFTNVSQASRPLVNPDVHWQYYTPTERLRLNLSKLFYSLEACREIADERGDAALAAMARNLKGAIERYAGLHSSGDDLPLLAAFIHVQLPALYASFSTFLAEDEIPIAASTMRVDIDGHPRPYRYDTLQLHNISNFLRLVSERGIDQLDQINEFVQGTGIYGCWAYYGINHHIPYPEIPEGQTIQLSTAQCLECLEHQPSAARYFLAQMRLYSDVLSRLDVTAEFTTLLKVLDDLAEGRPLSKPEAYAGGLLQRAPEIFNQLRHQNGLGDALSLALAQDKEFQENHRRFPDFTSDIDGIVSMYVDNFKDCFPALYLGIEIAPYAQAMQLTESLLRAA